MSSAHAASPLISAPALVVLLDRPRLGPGYQAALPAVACMADALLLRDKEAAPREFLVWALAIRERVGAGAVPLWVDGSLSVALASGAEGLHLPAAHLASGTMRAFWPRTLSAAVHDRAEAEWHRAADCLIWGHAFPTRSKPGLPPRQTLTEVQQVAACPILAIGGITADTCAQLAGRGLAGVVAGDGVWLQPDPARAAEAIRRTVLAPGWRA
ncbi:MAG: thiamine phosphate synthase [Firmicutes bacterium]|nr:thiamine phosphate synthase [Bacillota bacterium]